MDLFGVVSSPKLANVPDAALGLWLRALAYGANHGVDEVDRAALVRMSGSNKHVSRTIESLVMSGLFEIVKRYKGSTRGVQGKHKGSTRGFDSNRRYRVVIDGTPWILWKSLGIEPATRASDPDLSSGSVSALGSGSAVDKSITPPPVDIEGGVRGGNNPGKAKRKRETPAATATPAVFELTPDEPKPAKRTKTPPHLRPVDWAPKPAHYKLGEERGLPTSELEKQREAFKDFHEAKGSLFADWDAAFRTWIRNAGIYGPKGRSPYPGVQRPAPPGERTWIMPEAQ